MNSTQVLRRTLFSKAPSALSVAIAFFSFGVFAAVSAWSWRYPEISLAATRELAFDRGQSWRLVASLALHADLSHLLGNGLFFVPFAILLDAYFGFWVFPVAVLAGGVAVEALVLWRSPPGVELIGASGMVYFMVAVWIALYIGVERKLSLAARIRRGAGLLLAEMAPQAFDPHISYASHWYGFVFGTLFGAVYFQINKNKIRKNELWETVIEDDDAAVEPPMAASDEV